jgi:hypothetical protein
VAVADALLNRAELVVGDQVLRIAEVEVYVRAAGHPDPFAHAHPVQWGWGRWYFHRSGPAFRGGSFKGLDLTLGSTAASVGVLLRSVVAADGALTDGPSRLVDRLLAWTGCATVAELDTRLPGPVAFDPAAVVHLRAAADRAAPVVATARVGLSLKRARAFAEMPRYVGLPYRFLTEPRRIGPGRPQLVSALHRAGSDPPAIRARTGVPASAVTRYVTAFEEGRRERNFDRYVGVNLTPADYCRLLGTWEAVFSAE